MTLNKKKILFAFNKVLCTLVAFFINVKLIYIDIMKVRNPFVVSKLVLLFVGIVLFKLYYKHDCKTKYKTVNILSLLLSASMIIGNSYEKIGSWDLVFGSTILKLIAFISLIGYYFFFKICINILIEKIPLFLNYKDKNNKIINLLNQRPFLFSLIVILSSWLIYIIAFYPGVLSPDPSNQIKQFFQQETQYSENVILIDHNQKITNHHSVIHTLLLGSCIKIGHILGNDNFGIFIYTLIQVIIFATILAYTIYYLRKIKIPSKYCFVLLLIYSFVPMFPFYSIALVKDVYFTSFIILYVLFLFDTIYINKNKFNFKKIFLTIILLLLISLFRNNGIYVILLSFPLLIIFIKDRRKVLMMILSIFLILFICYSKIILPYFKITPGSVREALSVPFQQTARYSKEHDKEVTVKEKKSIDKVLGYKDLAQRYNPELADPVKNKYNKYTTKKELNSYFKTWYTQLIKHPGTYIEATLNNTYGYFYPNANHWYIYCNYDKRVIDILDYHYNNLSILRSILSVYGVSFPYIPIIGLLSNIAFNSWILLLLVCLCIIKHQKRCIIVLTPLLVSLLICFVSPANTYFRYAMPYLFSMPFMILLMYHVFNLDRGVSYEKK